MVGSLAWDEREAVSGGQSMAWGEEMMRPGAGKKGGSGWGEEGI